MQTHEIGPLIAGSELVDGAAPGGDAFILNSGDAGLLRSLDKLDAGEASRSTNGGATIAAHAQHVRYGLSLMNRWSREGASAFANPAWDEPWKISNVDEAAWREIRDGLSGEAPLVGGADITAGSDRRGDDGFDVERGAPRVPPWRHPTDQQGRARAERGHLPTPSRCLGLIVRRFLWRNGEACAAERSLTTPRDYLHAGGRPALPSRSRA